VLEFYGILKYVSMPSTSLSTRSYYHLTSYTELKFEIKNLNLTEWITPCPRWIPAGLANIHNIEAPWKVLHVFTFQKKNIHFVRSSVALYAVKNLIQFLFVCLVFHPLCFPSMFTSPRFSFHLYFSTFPSLFFRLLSISFNSSFVSYNFCRLTPPYMDFDRPVLC